MSVRALLVDEVGYADHVDSLLVSCELGCTKDDPAYFRRAAVALGHPPASLLLVDDSQDNVASARTAGLLAERWEIGDGVDRLRALLAGHGLLAP
ncbi:HAD-IA family hydrolase [Nocardioides sp. GCM10027113]|uniref:HAD-IA family hydrolase n=1 Tax=unclassified Nocardioides TaxID=2615069 RepID=UPI003621DE65